MVLWTELSNLFSVESDCPHREKFGYGGDIVAACEMAMMNFDMSRFYRKSVEDLTDAARSNGGFTETSPYVGISDEGLGGGAGPVGWGTAQPLLLWELYKYYGDKRLLDEQFAAAKGWIALLNERANEGILDNGISDHESLVPKPRALTGTAFYHLNTKLYERIARVLGETTEADKAAQQAEKIKHAFNARFLKRGTGRYDSGSQACQAFALYFGLVPKEEKQNALNLLVRDVEAHGNHLTTGIFGTRFILEVLAENGRNDVAYTLVNQRTFPGWGWMLENGATTLWEHWELSDNTYSHNHPMFGSVSEWFYKTLAGVRVADDSVGCNHVWIAPKPTADLSFARGTYDSVRGLIVSDWKRSATQFRLKTTVPIGTTATVILPTRSLKDISEGGKPLNSSEGLHVINETADGVTVEVGSGDYDFVCKMEKTR